MTIVATVTSVLRERLGWYGLHGVARVALRLERPLVAKRIVDRLGARMRPLEDLGEARRAAGWLDTSGTCLSRAITLAARLPNADVVLAITEPGWRERSEGLGAHAWVEVAEQPVRTRDVRGREIARLSRAPLRPQDI